MAKYYLIQENRKELNIIDFSKIYGFGEFDSTNLKDIITFTGMYKDENELKQFLLHHNLIKEDNFNKKLKICYKYNKRNKTLMYGVTYEDDLKYFNEVNIKRLLYQNRKNYELLETLCNHYRNSYNQGFNIDTIRAYIRFFKQYEVESNTDYLDDDKKQQLDEYEKAINSFVFKELYIFDRTREEYKENFRGLRDLAMFLSYQIKKQNNQSQEKSVELKEFIEKHKNEFEEFLTDEDYIKNKSFESIEEISKPKTKSKKKDKKKDKNVPYQLTFEDMGWK